MCDLTQNVTINLLNPLKSQRILRDPARQNVLFSVIFVFVHSDSNLGLHLMTHRPLTPPETRPYLGQDGLHLPRDPARRLRTNKTLIKRGAPNTGVRKNQPLHEELTMSKSKSDRSGSTSSPASPTSPSALGLRHTNRDSSSSISAVRFSSN